MGYQPNILNKGDIVYINGVRLRAKYDFNNDDKNLLLKREEKPQTYVTFSGLGKDGCRKAEEIDGSNDIGFVQSDIHTVCSGEPVCLYQNNDLGVERVNALVFNKDGNYRVSVNGENIIVMRES